MATKKVAEVMIVNRRSKKALQATGLDNGMVVEQAAPVGSDAQLWSIVEGKNGAKIVNKASGKVLDVMSEGTDNGTWAQTWEDVAGESQVWNVVSASASYKKLVNVRSGKVLDIVDMSDEDGAPAQIWEDVDGAGQQWKLVAPKAATPKAAASKTAKMPAAKKPAAKKAVPAAKPAPAVEKKAEAAVEKSPPPQRPFPKPRRKRSPRSPLPRRLARSKLVSCKIRQGKPVKKQRIFKKSRNFPAFSFCAKRGQNRICNLKKFFAESLDRKKTSCYTRAQIRTPIHL